MKENPNIVGTTAINNATTINLEDTDRLFNKINNIIIANAEYPVVESVVNRVTNRIYKFLFFLMLNKENLCLMRFTYIPSKTQHENTPGSHVKPILRLSPSSKELPKPTMKL